MNTRNFNYLNTIFDRSEDGLIDFSHTEPKKEEKVLGRIMGYGFPENTIYYIYKAKEVQK